MIVIATHNNCDILKRILDSLQRIDLAGHEVSIIDTNSTDVKFIEYFDNLKLQFPYNFYRTEYTCYDSGAYIWAYQNLKSDKWIFLQDSIDILRKDWIRNIDNLLNEYEVVAGWDFLYSYDPFPEQKEWVELDIEFTDYPQKAIFGPIFAVRNDTMNRIPKHWLKYPTNKLLQQGMERRWSLMFHSIKASKIYLEAYGGVYTSPDVRKYFYLRP
jgi:hypothetical protein